MLVSFAKSSTAVATVQCDSECIFVTLEIHLTTLFSEIFCFGDFFGGGTGQDGTDKQTNKRTNRHRDRQTFLGKYYFRLHILSARTQIRNFVLRLCMRC